MTAIALVDDEDRAALRKLARDVAERDIAPHAAHWDETEEFAEQSLEALRRAELFTVTVGETYGGMGMGDVEAAIVLEELARVDVSSAILCQLVFNGPPRAIEHLGSEELRRRWLPQAAAGELFCIGITEPDAGSAATAMRAHLVPDGDGYRLEAYKNYVTGGHKAVACLVWCRFPGAEPGTGRGIGAVVVDLSKPGVSVAGTHKKMGLRGCTEAELAFDGVPIDPADVLVVGDPATNEGLKTLLAHINHERCGNAAMCLGAAQGALEYAIAYMLERKSATSCCPSSRACSGRSPTWASPSRGPAFSCNGPSCSPAPTALRHRSSRRWPRSPATSPPSRCATRPCSCSAATATAASTRSNVPIAT